MYLVKFSNPALPGKGFIEGYKRAAAAQIVVAKINKQYERDGGGIKAEYLGASQARRVPHAD